MFRPTLKFEKIKPGGDVNFVNRPQIRKTLKNCTVLKPNVLVGVGQKIHDVCT